MVRYPFRVLILACLSCLATAVSAQDLRNDKSFFEKKRGEYNQWLRRNQLGQIFRADSVAVNPGKVTLYLRPVYDGPHTCDSLQCTWQRLEKNSRVETGQVFHERLLHKWAFLAEVHEEQAEVVVRCHEPAHFRAIIYSENGRIPVDERNIRSGYMMEMQTPADMQGINTGNNTYLFRGKNVNTVCNNARRWLVNCYKNKGTPILWKARVDTSYTAYDEFVLEVTHLSYEICPDGYFEYHRIYVKGVQKGDDVELTWQFQGKYGSGIIFPPRKNDYKDMELKYKNELEEYQAHLFKKLIDYLRR